MANFAALIQSLVISGSRKSDGTANASGKVYAYLPDTSTSVNLYADASAETIVTQPITLDAGGRISRSDYPDGVFCKQVVRLVVQTSDGTMVSDSVYVPSTAGATGYDPDQTNAAFTRTNVNDILQDAGLSFGGTDWYYLIANGQTPIKFKDAVTAISVNVKAFGAKGDGVAIDTTPIQNALNYVKAAGGGIVMFPPGVFKVDQALTLSSATGVIIEGRGGSTITTTHATANVFTLASCSYCGVRGLTVSASTTTGIGISATSNDHLTIDTVVIANCQTGLSITGSLVNVRGCYIDAFGGGAAQRGIKSSATDVSISGGRVTASAGAAIEFYSTAARTTVHGVSVGAGGATATGVLLNSNLSGAIFTISGCVGLGGCTTPIDVTSVAVWPSLRQWGNGVGGPLQLSFATGTSQTPNVMVEGEIILNASSGGAGAVTVNLPTVVPSGADANNRYYDFVFINGAGGAVTWNLNAAYVLNGAVAVPATAAHTIQVRFRYDGSKFRECSRGDTVT
jgi:hypothetical protein